MSRILVIMSAPFSMFGSSTIRSKRVYHFGGKPMNAKLVQFNSQNKFINDSNFTTRNLDNWGVWGSNLFSSILQGPPIVRCPGHHKIGSVPCCTRQLQTCNTDAWQAGPPKPKSWLRRSVFHSRIVTFFL